MRDLSRVLEIYRLPTIHLSVRGERERKKKLHQGNCYLSDYYRFASSAASVIRTHQSLRAINTKPQRINQTSITHSDGHLFGTVKIISIYQVTHWTHLSFYRGRWRWIYEQRPLLLIAENELDISQQLSFNIQSVRERQFTSFMSITRLFEISRNNVGHSLANQTS